MNIDVSKIVNNKIKELEDNGTIQKEIEDSVEKTIKKAFRDATESYSVRREIENQVEKQISSVVNDIGLSAYNSRFAEQVKKVVQNVMNDDASKKVEEMVNDLLIQKHEGVKLSEIFEKYREWVCRTTDEEDKYERREFTCSLEIKEEGCFNYYVCSFKDEELDAYDDKPDIKFCIMASSNRETDNISWVALEGNRLDNEFRLGYLSEFECFIANLYYNKTEIILDVEDVNEDNYFDIDI